MHVGCISQPVSPPFIARIQLFAFFTFSPQKTPLSLPFRLFCPLSLSLFTSLTPTHPLLSQQDCLHLLPSDHPGNSPPPPFFFSSCPLIPKLFWLCQRFFLVCFVFAFWTGECCITAVKKKCVCYICVELRNWNLTNLTKEGIWLYKCKWGYKHFLIARRACSTSAKGTFCLFFFFCLMHSSSMWLLSIMSLLFKRLNCVVQFSYSLACHVKLPTGKSTSEEQNCARVCATI